MNADELRKLTTTALDQLRAALDQGHSEGLTALLKTMGRLSQSLDRVQRTASSILGALGGEA